MGENLSQTATVNGFSASIDAKLWKNVLNAISPLVDEVDVNATSESLRIQSMDPSHVALVNFEWKKDAFIEYLCPTPIKIRVSLTSFIKKLKTATEGQNLQMNFDNQTKKLTLILKGKWQSTYTEPTLDPGDEEIPSPKVAFTVKVRMLSSAFKSIIDQIQTVSDNICLSANPEKLTVTGTSEISGVTVEIDKGTDVLLELETKEPEVKALYNLNYVTEIVSNIAAIAPIISVEFARAFPMKITAELPYSASLSFYVAPRIEAE